MAIPSVVHEVKNDFWPFQTGDAEKALQLARAELDESRRSLADADRALSEARAESARRASQNRTLLGRLTESQVRMLRQKPPRCREADLNTRSSLPAMPPILDMHASLHRGVALHFFACRMLSLRGL